MLLLVGGDTPDNRNLLLNGRVVADGAAPVPEELLVDALERGVLLDLRPLDAVAMVLGILVLGRVILVLSHEIVVI